MEPQSGTAEDVIARARELVLAEQFEPAIALLCEHLTTHPDDGVAWRRLSGALIGHGDHAAAVDAAGRAIDLDPEDVAAHRHRALALHLLGRHRESYVDAKRAVELAPDDHEALSLLAWSVLNVDRDPARARVLVKRALTLNPGSAPARDAARRCRTIRRSTTAGVLFLAAFPIAAVLMFWWYMTVDTDSAGDARRIIWPDVAAWAVGILSALVMKSARGAPPMLTPPQAFAAVGAAGIIAAGAGYGATRECPVAIALGLASLAISGVYSFLLFRRGAVRRRARGAGDRSST